MTSAVIACIGQTMSEQPTLYRIDAKELDALLLWSGPLGDMAKAAIGFLTGFDVLMPVERCEHGMIDPHTVEYPHNFPQSKGICDGSPTLDPFSEKADHDRPPLPWERERTTHKKNNDE